MNLELKQVKNLTEKKQVKDSYMGRMAHAKTKGEKSVEIDGKEHPVTMSDKTAKAIKKSKKDNGTAGKNMAKDSDEVELTWEQAVRKAQDTAVQTSKEYWEEEIRKNQEGWGSQPGVPGKGRVVPGKRKYKQMQ